MALGVLDEACDEPACLEAVIRHNPPLLKHAKGKSLMLRYAFIAFYWLRHLRVCRFMSSPNGLKLLRDMDFISSEMELWKGRENVAYLLSVEENLSEVLSHAIWVTREKNLDQR